MASSDSNRDASDSNERAPSEQESDQPLDGDVGLKQQRSVVLEQKEILAQTRIEIQKQHDRGVPPVQVCAKLTAAVDSVIHAFWNAYLAEMPTLQAQLFNENCVLVAHGGYGRRQLAPYSDIDLMVLYEGAVRPLAESISKRLMQDIFDLGLDLGHSLRTKEEAVQLSKTDAVVATSLIESRPLVGSPKLFDSFYKTYSNSIQKRDKSACVEVSESRRIEREKYGSTVYLLEPNVKRSRGGLRDVHLLRWLWFIRTGISEPDQLLNKGIISKFDHRRFCASRDFLLRTRNELHFMAGKSGDALHRADQLKIAEKFGYASQESIKPVERFMSDYFRHAAHIWFMTSRMIGLTTPKPTVARMLDPVLSRSSDGDFKIGLYEISTTNVGLAKIRKSVDAILRLVDLARVEDKWIAQETWYTIYREAPQLESSLTPEITKRFLSILDNPKNLGQLLRRLHELAVLEKIIPDYTHARFLLQFNQYHKFTVDEHCLLSVELATRFSERDDKLGEVYRELPNKRLLHLALLLHDLGKGYDEDHSVLGESIAQKTGSRLRLSDAHTTCIALLVRHHLDMSLLAFRRDTSDPEVIKNFAELVGSRENLAMLFVLTCADMAAVGPGVLSDWKVTVLADLYEQTKDYFTDRAPQVSDRREALRTSVWQLLNEDERDISWYKEIFNDLSESYVATRSPAAIVSTMRRLLRVHESGQGKGESWGRYLEDGVTIELVAAVASELGQGVFAKLAGAISSKGLRIIAAEKVALGKNLQLLRFTAEDPQAKHTINAAEANRRVASLTTAMTTAIDRQEAPRFARVWGDDRVIAGATLTAQPNEVRIDTTISEQCAIIELFTIDRTGLLYEISKAIDELGLVIQFAKIATSLDQVVDVFYVTERDGSKPTDKERLESVHDHLMSVIDLDEN